MRQKFTIEEMLDIDLRRDNRISLNTQLYQKIMQNINHGKIPMNTRLPASRQLAKQLGISRNTVQNAYEQLKAEGYLHSRQGSGIFVQAEIPDRYFNSKNIISSPVKTNKARPDKQNKYGDFCPGIPDLDAFPHKTWARMCHKVLRNQYKSILLPKDPLGNEQLRIAIADYLKHARSVNCHQDQIIVTAGAQEAITLAVKVLLKPSDRITIEDPGYRGAYFAAKQQHARVIPIKTNADGIDIECLKKTNNKAKLIYVTPSHQYPLGSILPINTRLELLELANKNKSYIIEDDYDSEYHYQVKPLPSLQGLDNQNRVIYLGTFSKTLFPAIRLGFLVAPENLIEKFEQAKLASCWQTALFNQAVLTEFMNAGEFARHIKRMRMLYAEKYKTLIDACDMHLPNNVVIHKNSVGLHITLSFNKYVDDKKIVRHLQKQNLFPAPLSCYCHAQQKMSGLVIGFGNTKTNKIESSIKKIAIALKQA